MKNDRTLRVAIDAHMLGDMSGGNETYYRNVLQNMYPSEGMEIFLFVKEGIDVSAYEDRFTIVYLPKHGASVRNLIDIPLLCIKHHIDVLHMQYFIPFFRPCPVVTTIFDICFEHYNDIFTTREYIRQKILIKYAARKSKKIFTVSHYSKNDISECYKIPKNKITVTYGSVSDTYKRLTAEELDIEDLRSRFGINGEYILSVCNLQPRKNLKRLIEAFQILVERYDHKDLQLIIVGKKAWMYDEIFKTANFMNEKIAENHFDNKTIVFTDYVDEQELVRLYNGAKCFVYPSYFEGFGIPPLEAMACGTPVAVSHATSLPEVVGDAGAYFDPFDTECMAQVIDRLLERVNHGENKELSTAIKNELEKQTEKFSWRISAEKIVESYWDV